MALRADDLTDLFTAKPDGPTQPMGYRQGVIQAWNPITLQNKVLAGGTVMTDLPVLGVAEAASLQAGSVVGIMVVGSTWAIIGRIVIPNTADAEDAITQLGQRRQSQTVLTSESTTSATFVNLTTSGPAVSLTIPASGKVQVTVSSNLGGPANSAGVDVSGDFTEAPSTQKSLAIAAAGMVASKVELYEGLPAGGTCTFKLMYRSNGVDEADFSNRTIIVEAL